MTEPAVKRYRKRPVEVEAIQWRGDNYAAVKTFGVGAVGLPFTSGTLPLWIAKAGTVCNLQEGDWIIREPDGSGFYPCTAKDFAATYDSVGVMQRESATSSLHAALDGIRKRWASTDGPLHDRWLAIQYDVPRLVDAVEATLKLVEPDGGAEHEHDQHPDTPLIHIVRCDVLREAISRALLGEESSDDRLRTQRRPAHSRNQPPHPGRCPDRHFPPPGRRGAVHR